MTFQDDLNRMLTEGYDRLTVDLPTSDAPPLATITVHKHAAYLPLSIEQQLDAGLITEEQARAQGWTPYVPTPLPWRTRLRWRWQAWRERTGRKVGGWIAGVDLSERDEDW
jgi:hypothetical protein